MVDNTSSFSIGGGVYYNYRTAARRAGCAGTDTRPGWRCRSRSRHDPFGGTVKYFRLSGTTRSGQHPGASRSTSGTTGIRRRSCRFAFVGNNLRDLQNAAGTQGVGYGIALMPIHDLVIAARREHHLHAPTTATGERGPVAAGGEWTFAGRAGVRLGRWLRRDDRQRLRFPPASRRCRRSAPSTPASARTCRSTRKRAARSPSADRGRYQPSAVRAGHRDAAAVSVTPAGNFSAPAVSETMWRRRSAVPRAVAAGTGPLHDEPWPSGSSSPGSRSATSRRSTRSSASTATRSSA